MVGQGVADLLVADRLAHHPAVVLAGHVPASAIS
jgi:hypothetical protein